MRSDNPLTFRYLEDQRWQATSRVTDSRPLSAGFPLQWDICCDMAGLFVVALNDEAICKPRMFETLSEAKKFAQSREMELREAVG